MSYRIYQTDAYIIESSHNGESSKLYYLLTADFGTILASARGSRKLDSKLRYGLQDLSFGKFSLVRGKDIWHITGVLKQANLYDERLPIQFKKLMAETLMFIKRLSPGEAVNKLVYEEFGKFVAWLYKERSLNDKESLEIVALLIRLILVKHFGYGSIKNEIDQILNEIEREGWQAGQIQKIKSTQDGRTGNVQILKNELSEILAHTQL